MRQEIGGFQVRYLQSVSCLYFKIEIVTEASQESTCQCRRHRDAGLIPGSGGSPGGGHGTLLQYSCLENPKDRGAWWATVHGVANSRPRLSDFTFTFHFRALQKEMATYSSVLAWRIPGMGEPGGLPSMGLQSRTQLKWLSSSSVFKLKMSFFCR